MHLTLKDGLSLGCSYFIVEPIWSILLASSANTLMLEIRASSTPASKQLGELFGCDSVYRGFYCFISVILSWATLLRVCLIRTIKLYPEKKNCHLRSKSSSTYFWMVLIFNIQENNSLNIRRFSSSFIQQTFFECLVNSGHHLGQSFSCEQNMELHAYFWELTFWWEPVSR